MKSTDSYSSKDGFPEKQNKVYTFSHLYYSGEKFGGWVLRSTSSRFAGLGAIPYGIIVIIIANLKVMINCIVFVYDFKC